MDTLTPSTSWWVEDFEGRKDAEQQRMRRELPPEPVQRALDAVTWLEQQELLGRATERNGIVATPHGCAGERSPYARRTRSRTPSR
jgi:hypothetical protein